MSLSATCWWTLARTVLLCLLAWPVCRLMERSFTLLTSTWRPWFLTGLVIPCCFPELLVGYAFRDLALARPYWAEALCSGLLLVRIIPVGTIALLASPGIGMDETAIHCRWMLFRSGPRNWDNRMELAWCFWHGKAVRMLPALALMSIVAFQEFEMAALLQTTSWTDWFVTAQWQGLQRQEMLRQSLMPLLWQTPVLLGVLYWLHGASGRRRNDWQVADDQRNAANARILWGGVASVLAAVMVGCLIPLGLMGWRTFDGFRLLVRQRPQQIGLAREILTSGAIAICAAVSAWVITGRLQRTSDCLAGKGVKRKESGNELPHSKGWLAKTLTAGLLVGLFGSLLLSLGCVALFQTAWLRPLYDTPIPWILTLTVWLLPRAAILRVWLGAWRNSEAIHLAEQLDQRARPTSLLWHLRDQSQFLAACLLWYWAYCDLPSAYMLAPTGMASGLVRLYNFMHFGRSAALSAEASVFFGVPVVCLFLLLIVNRKFR